MPEPVAASFTHVDLVTRDDAHYSDSTDLERVLGRTPMTFAEAARRWARSR